MSRPPLQRGTYRLTLTHEQSGTVALDHEGMDGETTEQVLQTLVELWPAVQAVRGAGKVLGGLQEAFAGLQGLGVVPAKRKHRGRR